jgi:hypothetical protein
MRLALLPLPRSELLSWRLAALGGRPPLRLAARRLLRQCRLHFNQPISTSASTCTKSRSPVTSSALCFLASAAAKAVTRKGNGTPNGLQAGEDACFTLDGGIAHNHLFLNHLRISSCVLHSPVFTLPPPLRLPRASRAMTVLSRRDPGAMPVLFPWGAVPMGTTPG